MASPQVRSRAERAAILKTERPATRRGNWWALGVGTIFVATSFFVYGAAMAEPETIDGGLVGIALLLAVAAFFVIAYISGRDEGGKRALQAMVLLVLLALPFGLLSRVVGAVVGLGVGVVVTLNPPRFANVIRNRLLAVAFAVAYAFLLLVLIPPAGVLTGALLPALAVGLADEYTAWRASKRAAEG